MRVRDNDRLCQFIRHHSFRCRQRTAGVPELVGTTLVPQAQLGVAAVASKRIHCPWAKSREAKTKKRHQEVGSSRLHVMTVPTMGLHEAPATTSINAKSYQRMQHAKEPELKKYLQSPRMHLQSTHIMRSLNEEIPPKPPHAPTENTQFPQTSNMLLTPAGGSGSYLAMAEDLKRPKNPMAQFGYSTASKNPFDNSIVLIDEAHNLTRGSKAAQEAQATCRRLKTHLVTTQNTTLVCFTGTPVADNPKTKLANLEHFLASQV